MAKSGLHCCTEAGKAHSLAYSLDMFVKQQTLNKVSPEDKEFVPEDKKSHLQSYLYETEQGQSS